MATKPQPPKTTAELRKFGITVGIAFAVLAGLFWWRGHLGPRNVLGAVSGVLVLGGLAAPAALRPVERAWMGLAHLLSKVTTPIFMSIVYFVVLTPTGLLRRGFGGNPLRHAPEPESYWHDRGEARASDLTRQF